MKTLSHRGNVASMPLLYCYFSCKALLKIFNCFFFLIKHVILLPQNRIIIQLQNILIIFTFYHLVFHAYHTSLVITALKVTRYLVQLFSFVLFELSSKQNNNGVKKTGIYTKRIYMKENNAVGKRGQRGSFTEKANEKETISRWFFAG